MGRAIEQIAVGPEDILGAVAVVDVEVDDGDALGAIVGPGIVGRDGGGVEQAEAHGAVALGMVTGRAHGAKHIIELTAHHRIDPAGAGAHAAIGRLEALGVHPGIGIERFTALLGGGRLDHLDIALLMRPDDVVAAPQRCLLARQSGEHLVVEDGIDRLQPVGPLGVSERRVMLEAYGMGEQ
jgi:hypothetical protein